MRQKLPGCQPDEDSTIKGGQLYTGVPRKDNYAGERHLWMNRSR